MQPVVYKDSDFVVYLEMSPIGPVIHTDVNRWSKDVFKRQFKVLQRIKECLYGEGYGILYAPALNEQLINYASMFGFELSNKQAWFADGNLYQLMELETH